MAQQSTKKTSRKSPDAWIEKIREEKEKKTGRLDLGQCGLNFIPDEIAELEWLEELILGNNTSGEFFFRYLKEEGNYYDIVFKGDNKFSKNDFGYNLLSNTDFSVLKKLRKLRYVNISACGGPANFLELLEIPSLEILLLCDNDLSLIPDGRVERYNRITNISSADRSNLKVIDFSGCAGLYKLYSKSDSFSVFRSVTHLGLSRSQLESLNYLNQFRSIVSLDIGGNHSLKNIPSFPPLENLRHLFIDASSLINAEGIGDLAELRTLTAGSNAINDISFLKHNKKLTYLNLGSCRIESIESLKDLKDLTYLDLSRNNISDITSLAGLQNLQYLDVGYNRIKNLEPVKSLQNLQVIKISENEIADISVLENLKNLTQIYAGFNKITESEALENTINSLLLLNTFYVVGNPVRDIPQEILGLQSGTDSLTALRSYFSEVQKGATLNNEVKLILVGNSTAGKTTLRKVLQGKQYNSKEDSTHGIVSETWVLKNNELTGISDLPELRVHIWDFGGQEYYHETHRLFFSQHALYIVVWEQSTDKHEIISTPINETDKGSSVLKQKYIEHQTHEYWIKNIRHYAPGSPIILVQNKTDRQAEDWAIRVSQNPDLQNTPFRLKRADENLLNKYNIEHSFDISLKKYAVDKDPDYEYDFKKMERILKKELARKASSFKISNSYNSIKKQITNLRKKLNYISYDEYRTLCERTDKDINIAHVTDYLTNTSVLIHYNQNARLAKRVFINPIWISDTVYKILDKTVLEGSGFFTIENVINVLDNNREAAEDIIELMKEFQIVFEKANKSNDRNFIAPQYLPEGYTSRSFYLFKNQSGAPKFTLRFPKFLPRTIMNRVLSIYAGRAIDGNCYYKYGVAFEDGLVSGGTATNIIECDYDNSEILFFSNSNDLQNQRTVFQTLLLLFDIDITDNNLLTETQMLDAVSKSPAIILLSVDGQNYINWNQLFSMRGSIDNDSLLLPEQGVQVKAEIYNPFFLTKDKFISYISIRRDLVAPPRVFISYAHEDELYKNELLEHLSGLINEGVIKDWTDRVIRPGEKWDDAIKKALKESEIILFLVSSSFMASRYINNVELKVAMQRSNNNETTVIPIHIRPCDYKSLPLKTFQKIPRDAPVVDARQFPTRDFAWEQVVKELKEEIKRLQTTRSAQTN